MNSTEKARRTARRTLSDQPKAVQAAAEFIRTGKKTDPLGSYTGAPQPDRYEKPVQDADDL